MSIEDAFSFHWGAITLLDFLGWKGVWVNDYKQKSLTPEGFNHSSLQALADLIKEAKKICEKDGIERESNDNVSGCTCISISDTIAIFSPCKKNSTEDYTVLKQHSEICSEILNKSALAGFAMRGAVTIGEYGILDNIIVGPGVDECASWYEQTDWLGVIFAPSAQFVIDEYRRLKANSQSEETPKKDSLWSDSKIIEYKKIPAKNGVKGIKYCVAWGEDPKILDKILANTVALSIDIAIKYINTNDYLYTIRTKGEFFNENQ